MNKTALLGLHAETPIHAGASSSAYGVDLPIQREAPTDWPCIFGSSMKGALRARAEADFQKKNLVRAIFGPDTDNASDHAGAVSIGDARLLLLPVRSLSSHFKWVTCPALLKRFANDCRRLGISGVPEAGSVPDVVIEQILVVENSGPVFLEEFCLDSHMENGLNSWIDCFHRLFGLPVEDLKHQLTVVHNDLFSTLTRFGLPVNAHIALDSATKTVKQGALWYEETLPPETVLYVPVLAGPSRYAEVELDADVILTHLTDTLFENHPYLQVGGNETTGMGWFRVSVTKAN